VTVAATRWIVLVVLAVVALPVVAGAQTPAPPIAVPPAVPAPGVPGNPTNPADPVNNPYPTMPWVGITTPYGQFIRWVWMPPQAVSVGEQVVQQPGFWAAQTTVGYYYPERWVLSELVPGDIRWVLMSRGFVPFAR
jgi:hypothetical protein